MVASGADAASGLESAFAFVGRTVPPFLRRDAVRAVARTRVAWHHPAHAAPAVYGSLTVELLAAGCCGLLGCVRSSARRRPRP